MRHCQYRSSMGNMKSRFGAITTHLSGQSIIHMQKYGRISVSQQRLLFYPLFLAMTCSFAAKSLSSPIRSFVPVGTAISTLRTRCSCCRTLRFRKSNRCACSLSIEAARALRYAELGCSLAVNGLSFMRIHHFLSPLCVQCGIRYRIGS